MAKTKAGAARAAEKTTEAEPPDAPAAAPAKTLTKAEILEAAKAEAKLWLAAFTTDGSYDLDKIQSELEKKFEGSLVICVEDPADLPQAIVRGIRQIDGDAVDIKKRVHELTPWSCIWDYYLMAFYECACGRMEAEPEFTKKSFFEAYKAGLGHIVNLGGLIVGLPRPRLVVDAANRLTNAAGPAIEYKRTKLWWHHGVQVPQAWIERPDTVDPKVGLTEANAEKRRAFYEIMGYERILAAVGAEVIQKDDFGTLLSTHALKDDGDKPALFVRVKCPSTGREYVNRVNPECKTAKEAVASRWRLTEGE